FLIVDLDPSTDVHDVADMECYLKMSRKRRFRALLNGPEGEHGASMQRRAHTHRKPALPGPEQLPGILQHLIRLSETFTHEATDIPFLHVYARPGKQREVPLEFVAAAESGPEGIACIDDVARAALLALQVYEETHAATVLKAARAWLDFVLYMQEPDGRFVNFIR